MNRRIGFLISVVVVAAGLLLFNSGVSEVKVPARAGAPDNLDAGEVVPPDFSGLTPDAADSDSYSPPPEGAQPSPTATSAAARGPTASPAAKSSASTPTPAAARPTSTAVPPSPSLPPLPDTVNVVLLGSDSPIGSTEFRTDVMIVVMIDPKSHAVGVVNIPRDLFVNIPGRSPNRVNTLDEFGGPKLVKQVLGSTLGVPIDYYARIDFGGTVKAIDALGGITVQVDCALEEGYPDSSAPGGIRRLKVVPGRTHMTGIMALDFSRSRQSTSVWDRMRRQNRVLLGVREKLLSPDMFPRIPALWNATKEMLDTDMPATMIVPLAKLAAEINLSSVHGMTVDWRMVTQTYTPAGAWVLIPNLPAVRAAVRNVFHASALTDAIKQDAGC